ncbi:MAG: hypothetical protein ACFFC7_18115 [Candidatus Hermodarchaeota archaeon]
MDNSFLHMQKLSDQKLMIPAIVIIVIVFATIAMIFLPSLMGSTSYSKTWIQSTGSLKVTISPNSAIFEAEKEYIYTITLEPVAFASNQDGFYSLAVCLRFLNSKKTFKSDFTYIGDLSNIGSKKQALIRLVVPSADEFPLNPSESLQGQLQYIIYYTEQPYDGDKYELPPYDMFFYTEHSIGWETIIQGKI